MHGMKWWNLAPGTAVCVMAAAVGLAACGSVTVVRESGPGNARPPETSGRNADAHVVVGEGDTLYGIASRNGIDTQRLAEWNGLEAPYLIHPGQSLRLYPPTTRMESPEPVSAVVVTEPSRKPVAAAPAPVPAPVRRMPDPPQEASPAARPASPGEEGDWRWPADGEVLVGGSAGIGASRPGIDIAGRAGSPVRAVADGVVLYSGAGSAGYEELIVIRHGNGWVSSYAHNRRRLVREGQPVEAGMQIAEMGRTGASRDMLHFELRDADGGPRAPLSHLPDR